MSHITLPLLLKNRRPLDPNDRDPCRDCGHCCRYVTVKLATPRGRLDFDEIRWFLLHENVFVFIDDDGWHVEFHTACRHLDGWRCGAYESRPRVCSDYTVDQCERYGEGDPFIHYFRTEQDYLEYLRRHRPRALEWVLNPRPTAEKNRARRTRAPRMPRRAVQAVG